MANSHNYFFRQYPKVTLFFFLLLLAVIVMCCAEIWLKYLGFQPGLVKRGWNLFPADSLIETNEFYTNQLGLHVSNPHAFYRLNPQDEPPYCINSSGFRTHELNEKHDTAQHTILLLGDSFAWGGGAEPIERSFADIIDRHPQYFCLNTGIPGTDPAQYAEVARLYVPVVKPDVVVCAFFTGNDLMYYSRPISPDYQLFYWTNAGALIGYPPQFITNKNNAQPFNSAQEAYRFVANHYTLWNNQHNAVKRFCSKYRITTLLWYAASNFFSIHPEQWFKKPISAQYLQQINTIARQNNAKFLVLLIPTIDEADLPTKSILFRYQKKLPDVAFNLPPNLSSDFYLPMPNGHLNNNGHRYYAQYLTALLDSVLTTH